MAPKNTYTLEGEGNLLFDGETYEPGDPVEMDEKTATSLVEKGRLKEKGGLSTADRKAKADAEAADDEAKKKAADDAAKKKAADDAAKKKAADDAAKKKAADDAAKKKAADDAAKKKAADDAAKKKAADDAAKKKDDEAKTQK